ncbi:MAG: FAD-dependent monooxygenase [Gammaproteobacteria bacterium]
MQFHLNGFNPGDPRFSDPKDARVAPPVGRTLPATCDVMIVGCGPAGLNLAAQLSQFGDIHTCIADAKSDRLLIGQADGIACRTVEMFQAYGFASELIQEAYRVNEVGFWKPDPANPAYIARSSKIDDVEEDLSEMPHLILNQARVHDYFLDVMKRGPGKVEPVYSHRLVNVAVDQSDSEYPVRLSFIASDDPEKETHHEVRCKYAVGCDGARSQVRQSIGQQLVGDALNQAWGVMDVLLVTDFPDIRLKAVIQSASEGNILIIPREGGYMVRLYIELDQLKENQRVDRAHMTPETLIDAARRIMAPYTLDVKEVPWWSVYEIGQRLTTSFDDRADGYAPRVFLAGDACHTHSPKAGQGMNTSLADTWNLGWKMAHVLLGRADESLLATYADERHAVAEDLINFDREFARMISAKPRSKENPDGVDPAEFQKYFQLFGQFTAGVAIQYRPSMLVGPDTHQSLAAGQVIGKRFHSAPVIRHGDAKPVQLGHCMTANGAWRIFAFAGRAIPMSRDCGVRALAEFLSRDSRSPVRRFTPEGADIDSVIDCRAVFQAHHHEIERSALHAFLKPAKGRYGLEDFEKVFCVDHRSGKHIYDMRGIDKERGCIIIVRPDQYVASVLPLDDCDGLSNFFEGVLKPVSAAS